MLKKQFFLKYIIEITENLIEKAKLFFLNQNCYLKPIESSNVLQSLTIKKLEKKNILKDLVAFNKKKM